MTHIRQVSSGDGNLIDVYYFCSAGCWTDSFEVVEESEAVERGGWSPCSESDAEGDVYCDVCGVLIRDVDRYSRPSLDPEAVGTVEHRHGNVHLKPA